MTAEDRKALRTAFAAASLMGWRAAASPVSGIYLRTAAEVAKLAYKDADAMLAELDKAPE